MKQNGFIASSLLYGMLALFLVIMLSTLATFANNKLSMDKLREKALGEASQNNRPESETTIANLLPGVDVQNLPEDITSNRSGPGLYKDKTEKNRYIYRGDSETNTSNPYIVNNYICLDQQTSGSCQDTNLYRIISIESDGTIKVIKYKSIVTITFDPGYSSNISGLKTANTIDGTRYSNNSSNYCYSSSQASYNGCNLWDNKAATYPELNSSTLPSSPAYLNMYLNGGTYSGNGKTKTEPGIISSFNNTIKNNIVEQAFNIGRTAPSSTSLKEAIESEQANKWIGKIGLLNATDYVKASTNTNCNSINNYLNNENCFSTSKLNNWLYTDKDIWTLTPSSENNSKQYYIKNENEGKGKLMTITTKTEAAIHPVFFLKSSLSFNGTGTKTNPYRIL